MKLIKVIDEHGKTYSSTYYKRAKGLVKKNRARWVDESTICLVVPLQTKEKEMKNIDFERLISLTVAGNYAIKNRTRDDYHLGSYAIKALCDTYDEIIEELEEANIVVAKSLGKICFDDVEKPIDANKLHDLENLVYTKNCLLNPVLKLEKAKFEKNKVTNNNSQNKNININFDNGININVGNNIDDDDYDELQELEEELENLNDEYCECENELDDLNSDLTFAEEDLEEFTSDKKKLEKELIELKERYSKRTSDSDIEEIEEIEEEINEILAEISQLNDEIEVINDDISNYNDEIIEKEGELANLNKKIEIITSQIIKLKK